MSLLSLFRLLAPLLLLAAGAAAADYDSYLTGNAADARPARTTGGLLLSGGGGDNDDAFRWFVSCAGGGDIVILRASGKDGYNDYLFNRIGGVDSVESLVFHRRAASTDARVLEIIAGADGIFLAGGDQSNYINYWKDTPVAAALNAHVRAGKPLGGASRMNPTARVKGEMPARLAGRLVVAEQGRAIEGQRNATQPVATGAIGSQIHEVAR